MKNRFNPYKHKARLLKEIASPIGAVSNMDSLKGEDESQDFFDSRIKSPFLLISYLQKQLCRLYTHEVRRTISVESEPLEALLREIEESFSSTSLEELVFLTGTVGVKTHYDSEDDKIYTLFFDSALLDATPSPTNPLRPQEIVVEYTHSGVSQSEAWSSKSVTIAVDGSKAKTETNPYGFIPFTLFRNSELNISSSNPLFDQPLWSLFPATLELSAMKMYRSALVKYQSASLLKILGEYADDVDIGVHGIINITSDNGDADFINPKSDPGKITEALQAALQEISMTFGIQSDAFTIKSSVQSGISIEAQKKSVYEFVKNRSKRFRKPETELFEKAIRVLAHHRNIHIPDDFRVLIEYKLPKSPLDSSQIQEYQFRLLNHLISPADILVEENPQLSKEDAEKIIKANKAANSLFEEGA